MKRGNGEGTIAKLPDGRFRGRVRLGSKPDGSVDRPWIYGASRGEVQRKIAALVQHAEHGTRGDPTHERQTVAEFLERWLAAARTSTRPQTWTGYEQNVRLHIIPALGRLKLSALRPDAIQRLYADKLQDGLHPGTVTKIHIVLHRALEMAVRWNYLPRNPADLVDRPTVPKRELYTLGPAELNRLVARASADADRGTLSKLQARAERQWALLWGLAIHTGLREGELLALQWSDVDLDAGTLTIRRNLVSSKDQRPQFGEPKSNTSRRTVAIDTSTCQELRTHKARQAADRLAALDWVAYDLVFCTHVGTPFLRRNVLRAFKVAVRRAGLPETIHFHDLRHANATLMLRAGVPLKTASARLGHSGIGITADLYQHVATDLDVDAAERVARALSSNG